ncbi:MAG: hypothetical protein WCY29_06060 [Novosphingobium sp.]
MDTTRTVLSPTQRGPEARNVRISEAWRNFQRGAASREDADIILADLAKQSEYFLIADPAADGAALLRREGKREMMARILFLLDLPFSYMDELRRAASDEMQLDLMEGEI